MRRFAGLALGLALGAASAAAAETAAERGERCWSERGRGFAESGRVDPQPALCAAAAFLEAAAAEPDDLELAFRVVESSWFAARFALPVRSEALRALEHAVAAADRAVAEVDRRAGESGADARDFDARARRLAAVPGAGEAHFWAAVAWGVWGQEHGWMASARAGVVEKLREHAELALRLAPDYLHGGGYRLLGRIHTTIPRLPWVSLWADRQRGVDLLGRALASSRQDPRNLLFLAEALLDHRPGERAAALALLREAAARQPEPAEIVEQSETLAAARARLASEAGAAP